MNIIKSVGNMSKDEFLAFLQYIYSAGWVDAGDGPVWDEDSDIERVKYLVVKWFFKDQELFGEG